MRDEFLAYLRHERRYSALTLKAYTTDLDQVTAFLDQFYPGVSLEKADRDMLRSWLVQLVEKGISARSVARKMSAVKSFFTWAGRHRSVKNNPTTGLMLPKPAKRLPVFVDEQQMEQLELSEFFPDTFEGLRDRIIVELFYQTGIRSAELISLQIRNIDFQRLTIKVLGKRNKERIIPVGKAIINLMTSYLDQRKSAYNSQPSFFITASGRPVYPKLIYRVVNDYLGRVSSLRKKSPHVLRHTFATHMLGRGADLNAIKEILGHTSLAATQVYTHNSIEKLKEIHHKAHPKG